jgi:peptidyl-tRNA hydrolase
LEIKIGIDNREGKDIPGEKYVLQKFTDDEIKILNATLEEACEELFFTELFEEWL